MPNCVLGGACIVLYGMIASVGLRTLVENHVDFTKNRNLCIAAVMLVLAMGGATIGGPDFSFSGIGLGIISGILLNLIMPEAKEPKPGLVAHSVPEQEIVQGEVSDLRSGMAKAMPLRPLKNHLGRFGGPAGPPK